MSAIDRAFIRAYEPDAAPTASGSTVGRLEARLPAPPAANRSAPTGPHFHLFDEPAAGPHTNLSERRPLSSFAAAAPAVEGRFRPALEVDHLRWSAVAEALIRTRRATWEQLVQAVLAADDAGRSLIGVAGAARGAGCTTIVGCLARLLVESGKTVAVVDGDVAVAGLARSLGLAVDVGWDDVLAGRAPLADAVIYSNDDRLAILPLVRGGAAASDMLDGIHASVTAGVLRYHYDIVLFDLGAVADSKQNDAARRIVRRCRLDALLLVAPPGRAAAMNPARLAETAPELAGLCLGVIENEFLAACSSSI